MSVALGPLACGACSGLVVVQSGARLMLPPTFVIKTLVTFAQAELQPDEPVNYIPMSAMLYTISMPVLMHSGAKMMQRLMHRQ